MSSNYVITIARGYGSGGRTIGKMIAEDLGIPFYDREILYLASEDSGINIDLFSKADEKVKKGFLPNDKYTGDLIPPESGDFVSDKNLFNYQAKIIKELAEKGPCVIVGRCADYVLKDFPNTVDVFVWAPIEQSIENVRKLEPMLTPKEAEKKIKKINAYRGEYYKYYTCREWLDFTNYDICVNTAELGFEKSAELIKACAKIKLDK